MSISVVMLANVFAANGALLATGTTQTLADDVALDLIGTGRARYDVPPNSAPASLTKEEVEAVRAGSGGGGGTGYRGSVASQGAMTALAAAAGDECLRTDLGTGGLRYELTALPASSAGNWQALQGTLADASVVTLALVDGKLPRRLLVTVASGCQVTVAVGGVTLPVLPETVTGDAHEILVSDDVSAAQPTTLTIQRTAGSGTTSTYSLEY